MTEPRQSDVEAAAAADPAGASDRAPGASAPASPRPPFRVGHKGADHIAPGNTFESFRAAVEAGVDMIEFDVLPECPDGTGRLLLAHDYEDLAGREAVTLEEGLEHLAGAQYGGIELDVDVKLPGYGGRVVAALREAGLSERSLVSCTYPHELARIRALDPALRLGLSVPRVRRDYTEDRLMALPALGALAVMRQLLPRRVRAGLEARRFEAVMAHWRLVTPRLVEAVARGGGELFVWTVDDPSLMRTLLRRGVNGIITNDPRLFAQAEPAGTAG